MFDTIKIIMVFLGGFPTWNNFVDLNGGLILFLFFLKFCWFVNFLSEQHIKIFYDDGSVFTTWEVFEDRQMSICPERLPYTYIALLYFNNAIPILEFYDAATIKLAYQGRCKVWKFRGARITGWG